MIYHNAIKLLVCYALLYCCGCSESELYQGKEGTITSNRKFKKDRQELDSGDAHAMLEHSRELWQQRNLQKALKYARRAHKLNPNDPATSITIAGILLDTKKPTEAEKQVRDLLVKDPSNADAHLIMGYCLSEQGKMEEAEHTFRRVLVLANRSRERISAHLGLGAILEKNGDFAEADMHYSSAIAIEPELRQVLVKIQKERLYPQAVPNKEAAYTPSETERQRHIEAILREMNKK